MFFTFFDRNHFLSCIIVLHYWSAHCHYSGVDVIFVRVRSCKNTVLLIIPVTPPPPPPRALDEGEWASNLHDSHYDWELGAKATTVPASKVLEHTVMLLPSRAIGPASLSKLHPLTAPSCVGFAPAHPIGSPCCCCFPVESGTSVGMAWPLRANHSCWC